MGGLILALLVPASLVVAVAVLTRLPDERRDESQEALLWLMTVAVERLIPLVPVIEAFARERGGLTGTRARYLAQMLRSGVPLPDALARVPRLVPRDALPLIRVGCESGALAAALRQAASKGDRHWALWKPIKARFSYLAWAGVVGLSIVAFSSAIIGPNFVDILNDFGEPVPPMIQAVDDLSEVFPRGWVMLTVPLVVLGLLTLYVVVCRVWSWGFGMRLPDWITRRLDTAAILESLGIAAEHRRPMSEAIASLAATYHKKVVRRRLAAVAADTVGGADWCESLFAQGLLRKADLAILQAAQRAGNLPWAMREMTSSNRRRLAYRLIAAAQLLYPPILMVFAGAVAFFVIRMFLPLITLIENALRL